MNEIEIYFNRAGSTIVGSYSAYQQLYKAIEDKNVFFPHGTFVKGGNQDIKRLTEYVQTFGNCIKTLAGWNKACELAGVEFGKEQLIEELRGAA